MARSFFSVELVFLEKYINELSSDAFKVLLKMLYFSKTTDRDISIRRNRVLRRIIGMNIVYANSIWKELVDCGLVICKEKKNSITYILNGQKIQQDNSKYSEEQLRDMSVTVFKVSEDVKVDMFQPLTDDVIKNKIKQMFSNIDATFINNLTKTVQLIQKYNVDREKKFRLSHLGEFLVGLAKYDNKTIGHVCCKFNDDKRIAGNRGFRYFLRMLQGINIERPEFKVDEKVIEKRKEDGERKFSIKVATGKALSSLIYKQLLDDNKISQLKELWQNGVEILKVENRANEIYSDYEWLKK